tara:strand:+ start:595 stop:1521 length:927 start_codon:yes stop_codon:yes gene_type:complete
MRNVTIYGGSGYVGGSFYDFFFQRKDLGTLNLISRTVKSKFKNNENINLIEFDLEKNIGERLPNNSDVVFYAVDNTDYSLYSKIIDEKPSEKILNFTKICKKFYKNSKIIFVSSGAVYGYFDQKKKLYEEEIFREIHEVSENKKYYVQNKRNVEKVFNELGEEGFDVCIARCFTFIGPRIPLDKHFLIGNLIENFLNKKTISVNSNKQVVRSYMYWQDMVKWLLELEKVCSTKCPIFNLGSDIEINIDEIINTFEEIGSKVIKRGNINKDLDYYVPNISKIKNILSLDYEKDFKLSLLKTINEIKNIK